MVLVPDDHKSMPKVIINSNNYCHSVSCFPCKCIAASDMLTCTLSGCFPERTVTLHVQLTVACQFITLVSLLCLLADYRDDAIFAHIAYVPYA